MKRGGLYNKGANFAADIVLLRFNENIDEWEMLTILRKDCEQWAIPGGMVDPGEDVYQTTKRELEEETGIILDMADLKEIYKGYVNDPRNTEDSWIETTVLYKILDYNESLKLKLKAGSDAKEVQWQALTPKFIESLYAGHGNFLKKVLKEVQK